MPNSGGDIVLRPESAGDDALLFTLYASTRERELALTGWDEKQRQEFLRFQFAAMRAGYASAFPDAQFSIIQAGGQPIGRMVVHRAPEEMTLVDIVLLPQWRRRGIGTELLRRLMAEAAAKKNEINLHVFRSDADAARFYERLGFVKISEEGLHDLWRWRDAGDITSAPPND